VKYAEAGISQPEYIAQTLNKNFHQVESALTKESLLEVRTPREDDEE
jgi:hypothetical protein